MYVYIYIVYVSVYFCIKVHRGFECLSILPNFLNNIFYKALILKKITEIIVVNHKHIFGLF